MRRYSGVATKAQKLIDQAVAELEQTAYGYLELKLPASGHWATGLTLLAKARKSLDPPPKPPGPKINLGPVLKGGRSVLEQDLTHPTGGLEHYPAFDDGIGHPGLAVIAPEAMTVTKIGRFVRRDGNPDGKSVYGDGASKIEWVFGHLENVPAVGAKLRKGARVGTISPNHEAPHVHVGINTDKLLGHELAHHTNYTHGAATVGAQLKKAGF